MTNNIYLKTAADMGWKVESAEVSTFVGNCNTRISREYNDGASFGIFTNDDDRIVSDVWGYVKAIRATTTAGYSPLPPETRQELKRLAVVLRNLELGQWTVTDPDSFQVRRKDPDMKEYFRFYEVRMTPDEKYQVVSGTVDINDYSDEDRKAILAQFDGLLDDIDEDDPLCNALLAEAYFESEEFCVPIATYDTFNEAAKHIGKLTGLETEADRICNDEPDSQPKIESFTPEQKVGATLAMFLNEMFDHRVAALCKDMDQKTRDEVSELAAKDIRIGEIMTDIKESVQSNFDNAINGAISATLSSPADGPADNPADDFVLNDSALMGLKGHEEYHYWFDVSLSRLNGKYPDAKQAEVEITFPIDTKREDILSAATTAIAPVYENDDGLYSGDWEEYDMSIELLAKVLIKNDII